MKFEFTSRIELLDDAAGYHCVPVPDEISDKLRDAKITRLLVTFEKVALRRAIQGPHIGGRFVYIAKPTLQEIGKRLGQNIRVIIEPDPDPDFVEVCPEFEEALSQEPEAKDRWETFTPGKQRSLAHQVNSAKRSETRIKRAVDIVEKIRTHTLYGDKPKAER